MLRMGRFEGWVVFGWAGSAGEGPDLGQVVQVIHQSPTNWRAPLSLPPPGGWVVLLPDRTDEVGCLI